VPVTVGTREGIASLLPLCTNPRPTVIVILATTLGWTGGACGRTALLTTDAGTSLVVTSTGGSDASLTTSQPPTDGGCAAGLTACGRGAAARCYNLSRSVDHCGQCGNACAPGIACQSSKCQQHACKGALTFRTLPAIATVPSADTPTVPSADPPPPTSYSYVPVLGDFDGDGTLDFVGQTQGDASMGLMLGKGDGTFQAHAIASPSSSGWSAAAADLNGDGRLDLASIHPGTEAVSVRLGNGDPATLFAPETTYSTPSPPGNLLLADLDDDGHVDMVVAETQRLTLWRGTAGGRFAEPVDIPVGLAAPTGSDPGTSRTYALFAADWNQDGVLDLLYGASTLRLLPGLGDGTFDKEIACGLGLDSYNFNRNIPADFDHDQKPDMIVDTRVFLGMNDCNFSTSVPIPVPSGQQEVMLLALGVADLDGDGNPDIVAGESGTEKGSTAVYLGDGRGRFSPPLTFSGDVYTSSYFLTGDLNHDTKLDIIVTTPGGWQVLLNTCP